METIKKIEKDGHHGWLVMDKALILHLRRHGGVSPPPFDSLNLSSASGDRTEHVVRNLAKVKGLLKAETLVTVRQVHGTKIVTAHEGHDRDVEADGISTASKGVGLLVRTADCLGVVLFAPDVDAICALHCGWRGLAAGLASKGVRHLKEVYGADPRNTIAILGPCLGPCCAEFLSWRKDLPAWMHPFVDAKARLDMQGACSWDLEQSGLRKTRILETRLCTKCHHEFFSYRRSRRDGSNGVTGRNGTAVVLL